MSQPQISTKDAQTVAALREAGHNDAAARHQGYAERKAAREARQR
jgi:hypothetical protein